MIDFLSFTHFSPLLLYSSSPPIMNTRLLETAVRPDGSVERAFAFLIKESASVYLVTLLITVIWFTVMWKKIKRCLRGPPPANVDERSFCGSCLV